MSSARPGLRLRTGSFIAESIASVVPMTVEAVPDVAMVSEHDLAVAAQAAASAPKQVTAWQGDAEDAASRPRARSRSRSLSAENLSKIRDFIAERERKERYSIDPDAGWHTAWDLVMVALLTFVAIALPIELAFLSDNVEFSLGYWAWNRVIDVAFVLDLVMNFFLGYETEEGNVEREVKVIAKKYLSTWFAVDLISVLPFFVFDSEVLQWEAEAVEFDTESLRVLQILRLLRVLKIVRLLRASRIIKRWEDRFSFKSTTVEPIKYVFLLMFVIHCMACVLELSSNLSLDDRVSWEDSYLEDDAMASPSTRYLSALYWSCMTVTTIGYGDLVPQNIVETWTASIIMFVGSCIYAYVVGTIVGSLSEANPAEKDFQRTLDNLDDYMNMACCSLEHKTRLRSFFNKRALIDKDKYYKAVLNECSPEIQADLAARLYKDSLLHVKFMRPPDEIDDHRRFHFIGAVSMKMQVAAFPAHEFLITKGESTGNTSRMFIIRRGLVGSSGRIFSREAGKNVLGEDIICRSQTRMYSAKSLTFVEAVALQSQDLHAILESSTTYWAQKRQIRRHSMWVGFRNVMLEVMRRIKSVRMIASVADLDIDLEVCPDMLFAAPGQPFDPTKAIRRMRRAQALAAYNATRQDHGELESLEGTPRTPRSEQGPWSKYLDSPSASPRARSRSNSFCAEHARNMFGKSESPEPPRKDHNGLSMEERSLCTKIATLNIARTSPRDARLFLSAMKEEWRKIRERSLSPETVFDL